MKRIIACRPISNKFKVIGLKNGIRIEDYPFLIFDYLNTEELKELITRWNGEYIFTSQHALIALEKMSISTHLKGRRCFVISGTTKTLAVSKGFKVIGEAKNGKELGQRIPLKTQNKLLHLSSPDRRRELYDASMGSDIFIEFAKVYSKQQNQIKITGNYDAIAFFSPSQISAFLKSGNVFKEDVMVFCIGNTTKNSLPEAIRENAITANLDSIESVIDLVIKYYKEG